MPPPARVYKRLSEAQSRFLRASDAVPADLWQARPGAGSWSPGEIVAHLCQVERGVLSAADRISRKQPRPMPFFKKLHLPLFLVQKPFIRRASPIPLDAALLSQKESMLAELRSVRERTAAFLLETSSRDLSAYYWPHPFLGMLNLYSWFEMIAAHQIRHTMQMQRIVHGIPKDVVSS